MAMTIRQRRKRDRLLLIAAFGVILIFVLSPVVGEIFTVPEGYAKQKPEGQYTQLKWDDLQKGKWENNAKPEVPAIIAQATGKQVVVKGFLLPLHEAERANELFLAPLPRGCYFCNPPGINEVIVVKMAGARKVKLSNWPVYVYGSFRAATGSEEDMALYMIDDATLVRSLR